VSPLGEVTLGEGHDLEVLVRLCAAVNAVELALRLVAARIVVDDRDRVDAPAHRRLDLADVIPEARVSSEHHHRTLRRAAFRPEPGRKCPAEMAGAPDVILARPGSIVHSPHPHPPPPG